MSEVTVQKIFKQVEDEVDLAIRYYSLLFAVNKIEVPKMELELLAFTAVRGTITPKPARQEFVDRFGGSLAYLENVKGLMVKKQLLIKTQGKYRVNPIFSFDFSQKTVIQVTFEKKEEHVPEHE